MTTRPLNQRVRAQAVSEGAGVTVHRTLGSAGVGRLDPFLMLDHFGTSNPDEYIAGFPNHPHRGFVTLTYMLDGRMLHSDSMGNQGELSSGDVQWMKAGSGVIHSEMPQHEAGLMRGFQLWINLPAREKMSEPAYRDFAAAEFPQVAVLGQDAGDNDTGESAGTVKVIAGRYRDARGPIDDPHTDLHYFDVTLGANRCFVTETDPALSVFAYIFEGDARVGDESLAQHTWAVFGAGPAVEIVAGTRGARFILVGGRPLHEPVAQRGPFVMNTAEELSTAFADYSAGRLVRSRTSPAR